MNIKQLALIVLVTILATGCASSAKVDSMSVSGTPEQRIKPTPLRSNVSVTDVTGGKETNPMWTSQVSSGGFKAALEDSLKEVGLFAMGSIGNYHLVAHMEELKQPLIGVSMTVTSRVSYTLVDRQTGKTIYNRTIELPYTAAFSDALYGVTRLRLANEGAVRVNIEALINDLFMLDIDKVALSN